MPAKTRPRISTLDQRSTFFSVEPTDAQLVASLRAGDEAAFRQVVREWNASMLRVAQIFVPSRADRRRRRGGDVAARAQRRLDRFEGRSSLKTWVFRILVNTAKTRAQREGRVVPFSSLQDPGRVPEAAVERTGSGRRTTSAIPVTGRRRRASCRRSGCSPPRRVRGSPRRSTRCPRTRRR